MKQREDYISGPHNYWAHFSCGFVFGAFVAGWLSWDLFNGFLAVIIGGASGGLFLGLFWGKWGDKAWKAVFQSHWWRPGL